MKKTILKLKITLLHSSFFSGRSRIYRIIEISDNFTLYDFADAIVNLFDFDFDHAFGFYDAKSLSKAKIGFELFVDMGEPTGKGMLSVEKTKLRTLFELIGNTVYFLFDYGDEWWFKIELLDKREIDSKEMYFFRIIETKGTPPPQYPNIDEEGNVEIHEIHSDEPLNNEHFLDENEQSFKDYEDALLPDETEKTSSNDIRESFIAFLEENLNIDISKFREAFDKIDEILFDTFLGKINVDDFLFTVGYLTTRFLNTYPNDKSIINLSVEIAKKLPEFLAESMYLDTGPYFPIFNLLETMIRMRYNKEDIIDVFSVIPSFTDRLRDPTIMIKVLEWIVDNKVTLDISIFIALWVLSRPEQYFVEKGEEVFEQLNDSSKLMKSFKILLMMLLVSLPIFEEIYSEVLFGRFYQEDAISLLKRPIREILNSDFKNSKTVAIVKAFSNTVTKMSLSRIENSGVINITKNFVNTFYRYITDEKSLHLHDVFFEKLLPLIVLHRRKMFGYTLQRNVFGLALSLFARNLDSEKCIKILTFLINVLELNKDIKVRYLPYLADIFLQITTKIGDKKTLKFLEKLRKDSAYDVRLHAYKALYKLTNDKKYLQDALQDRAKKIRKWARIELENDS